MPLDEANTNQLHNDFYVKGLKIFNDLPDIVKKNCSLSNFKAQIQQITFEKWKNNELKS